MERISSLAEHTGNCLKVEYLAESNTILKNLVLHAHGTKRFRFLQNKIHAWEPLKVHKNENIFGFDFEFCTISLLVMSKY